MEEDTRLGASDKGYPWKPSCGTPHLNQDNTRPLDPKELLPQNGDFEGELRVWRTNQGKRQKVASTLATGALTVASYVGAMVVRPAFDCLVADDSTGWNPVQSGIQQFVPWGTHAILYLLLSTLAVGSLWAAVRMWRWHEEVIAGSLIIEEVLQLEEHIVGSSSTYGSTDESKSPNMLNSEGSIGVACSQMDLVEKLFSTESIASRAFYPER